MTQPSVNSVALIVHSATIGSEKTLSITTHNVHHHDRKSMLGEGRVFSTRDKQQLLSLLSDNLNMSMELLDEHCLAASQETLMWYRPRGRQVVNIQGAEIEVPLPSLIFLLHRRQLHVVSYKGDKRPNRDTKLFAAGLPNIGCSGDWCSGGNRMPANPSQKDMEAIERRFFLSPFTHWTADPVKGAGDMEQFFHDLSKKRSFPVSKLRETQNARHWEPTATMGIWMNSIVRER